MNLKIKLLSCFLSMLLIASALAGCGAQADIANQSDVDGKASLKNTNELLKPESVYISDNINTDNNNADNAIQGVTVTNNSLGGKDVIPNVDINAGSISLVSNGIANYKIVSLFTDNASVTEFASNLKKKTGAEFSIISGKSYIGGNQIVIGDASDLLSYTGNGAFKSYSGASVCVVGKTIYVSTTMLDILPNILDLFINQIELNGASYVVPSELKIASDVCAISENVPIFTMATETPPSFTTSVGTSKGTYSAGGGNYQITYKNIYASDVKKYNDQLLSAGYKLSQHNTMNSNSFYTFVKGDTMVHINWFPTLSQYSIVYGPKTYSLASFTVSDYQRIVTPSISQMALYNTGQSNVIQLEDGSFVIIDSGRAKGASETVNHDAEILYNFLMSKKPSSHAKPKITWIFTHAHSDHVNLARDNFLGVYKNNIDVQLVLSNFPDFTVLDKYLPSGATWGESSVQSAYANTVNSTLNAVKNNYANCKFYTFHTGEIIHLPGCEIEIIHTQEDYYLNGFKNVNDTSCVFKITIQGRIFMVYGDTTKRVNEDIYKRYGDYLKADILQISHHGVNDFMPLELLKVTDPDICLWPVRNAILTSDRVNSSAGYSWLKAKSGSDGQRERIHYSQNHTVTVSIPTMTITTKQWYSGGKSDSLDGRTYLG